MRTGELLHPRRAAAGTARRPRGRPLGAVLSGGRGRRLPHPHGLAIPSRELPGSADRRRLAQDERSASAGRGALPSRSRPGRRRLGERSELRSRPARLPLRQYRPQRLSTSRSRRRVDRNGLEDRSSTRREWGSRKRCSTIEAGRSVGRSRRSTWRSAERGRRDHATRFARRNVPRSLKRWPYFASAGSTHGAMSCLT